MSVLEKVKGIGPKTAKRMILELKDKMMKMGDGKGVQPSSFAHNNIRTEALNALMALGFSRVQADASIQKAMKNTPSVNTVEALIKEALRTM